MDRALFYAGLRKRDSGLFTASLTQSQVDGLERLLNVWERYYASDPIEFLAYNLATSYHETGKTMQPITERGPRSYFDKYEPGTKLGKQLGNTESGDGYRFRGEGDVQNTGRANAARATRELNAKFNLGVDLVRNPEKRGDPFISAHSLFLGNKEGWWTGRKLGDYIKPGLKLDFVGSRFVVNGNDRAQLIAAYATQFLSILKSAGAFKVPSNPVPQKPAEPLKPNPTPTASAKPRTLFAAIAALFTRNFKKG